MSVDFSHAVLSTYDNLAMQALVWLCMAQFRMIRSVVVWYGASYMNFKCTPIFKDQI